MNFFFVNLLNFLALLLWKINVEIFNEVDFLRFFSDSEGFRSNQIFGKECTCILKPPFIEPTAEIAIIVYTYL